MRRVTLHVTAARARTAAAATAAAAALFAAPLLVPATAHAAGGLTGLIATYAVTQSWSSGFEGHYTITNNTNATVTTWTLTFDLPAGEAVTSAWNGTLTTAAPTTRSPRPAGRRRSRPGATAAVVGMDVSTGADPDPARQLPDQQRALRRASRPTPPRRRTPTGLTVTGTGPGSISLAWNASTDNVGVVGYRVYEGVGWSPPPPPAPPRTSAACWPAAATPSP